MVFSSNEEVIETLKKYEKVPDWVKTAREDHKILNALVTGKGFNKVLIKHIEKIESNARKVARERYSKDIRDLFSRTYRPRSSVFTANGGSVISEFSSDSQKEKFLSESYKFKGQKSIKKYLSQDYFKLSDTDPNGLIFVEYKGTEKINPTYKSINDIRYYESDDQLCEFVIFEPKQVNVNGVLTKRWRVVDDRRDYIVIQNGTNYEVSDDSFDHPFTNVPAIILSDQQEVGSEIRESSVTPILKLSEDYARDKSIGTIYKFQHGFVRHWRYEKHCRKCNGTKIDEKGNSCVVCNGTGVLRINDVTDVNVIDMPREDQPIVTPNIEGFVAPPLDYLKWTTEDLEKQEGKIENTVWGTRRVSSSSNETATGRFIDVQPVQVSF